MKFDRKLIAPLVLALALSACGGGADEAENTGASAPEVTGTSVSEEATAVPTEGAAPDATASEEAGATPSATPSPSPTKSAAPAATASPKMAAVAATPPPAFTQCSVCHSTEPGDHGVGPSLAGVYGTKAGEIPGFKFSPAMKASGLTWDAATLDSYLKDPRKVVPGTTMGFGGVKDDAKRKAIIEFLKAIG